MPGRKRYNNYVPLLPQSGTKPQTKKPGRKCCVCGKPLSIYNPEKFCFCHSLEQEEKRTERIISDPKPDKEVKYGRGRKSTKPLGRETERERVKSTIAYFEYEQSREIYRAKHGHYPEDETPGADAG
jgi:hypothetical protein